MNIDPVCRMEVTKADAPTFEYQGKAYSFCCDACKSAFSEDPEKYLSKTDTMVHHHHDHHHAG